jgi:hypothetical protein
MPLSHPKKSSIQHSNTSRNKPTRTPRTLQCITPAPTAVRCTIYLTNTPRTPVHLFTFSAHGPKPEHCTLENHTAPPESSRTFLLDCNDRCPPVVSILGYCFSSIFQRSTFMSVGIPGNKASYLVSVEGWREGGLTERSGIHVDAGVWVGTGSCLVKFPNIFRKRPEGFSRLRYVLALYGKATKIYLC